MREICMLRSTRRGLETWHGRDGVTLADERARQRGTQTSTYTGAPVLDPTWERAEVKFLRATRHSRRLKYLAATSDAGHPLALQYLSQRGPQADIPNLSWVKVLDGPVRLTWNSVWPEQSFRRES